MLHPANLPPPAFSGRWITAADDMAPFLTDWRRKWTGVALAVAQPDSTADVAEVIRWCHTHRVPVVPQGGNTGLSGGAVPDDTGRAVVLSLNRLSRVREVDAVNNTLTVEAGCTLLQVQQEAEKAGRLFPLSLAAEGSCSIGGNLATNAGGIQVLRYGNARELCLGLEVVTPTGEVWNGLRGLRKDNTGYDLRDLYIGSEGTLGVITAAVLKLHTRPTAQTVALAAVDSPRSAVALLALAQARLGPALTAFELLSQTCMGLVLAHVPGTRSPLSSQSPWYVVIEMSTADESAGNAAFEALLEAGLEQGLLSDVALSASLAQFDALWALREDISESQAAFGPAIKHDISLPVSRIADFMAATDDAVATHFPGVQQVVFGHLGDGNLHYNVSPAGALSADKAAFLALEPSLNRLVHDAVVAHCGSISAEHGLGVLRRDESARYKCPVELSLMRAIKHALDPHGLMNPGKLLA
jgi:FAD/FMN-containing dehydrogenase